MTSTDWTTSDANLPYALVTSVVIVLTQFCPGRAAETPESVKLVDGATQQCCGYGFTHFTSAAIESMTDGNAATGFTYTSFRGDYGPSQTEGISELFVFDVSHFSTISQIDITWTGTFEWTSGVRNSSPSMRIGDGPESGFITFSGFDVNGMSTGNVVTGMRSFTGVIVPYMVAGGLASAWVNTTVSTTTVQDFFRVDTLEITAVVHGTRVPEPSTAVMCTSAALAMLARCHCRRNPVGVCEHRAIQK